MDDEDREAIDHLLGFKEHKLSKRELIFLRDVQEKLEEGEIEFLSKRQREWLNRIWRRVIGY